MTFMQSDEHLLRETLEAGADIYMQKPFETSVLQEVVGRCLANSEALNVLKFRQDEVNSMRCLLWQKSSGIGFTANLSPYFAKRAWRLILFFEHAPDAIAVTLSDGMLLEVNVILCSYTGYSKQELIGNPLSMLFSANHLAKHSFERFKDLSGEIVENERIIL